METVQDVWATKRRPTRHETQVDQIHPGTDIMKRFTAALLSQEPAVPGVDFFREAPPGMVSRLQGESTELMEPSFPLSLFDRFLDQSPTLDELRLLTDSFSTRCLASSPFLSTLPAHVFTNGPRYLTLSVASMGAIGLGDSQRSLSIWHLAIKTLMATLTIDNRHARDTNFALAWLCLGAIGVLSDDPKIRHVTNNFHGSLEVMVKRMWNRADRENRETLPGGITAADRSGIVFQLLLIDILRSLHLGMPPSTVSACSDIALEHPYGSISSLLSRTIFAGPQAEWPPPTPENMLLMLVLILNHIVVWAREMLPLTQITISTEIQGHRQLVTETHKSSIRIRRALEKWESCYKDKAPREVLALFFFCKIHLCLPRLHGAIAHKHCDSTSDISLTLLESLDQGTGSDARDLQEVAHFAWLVLEHIPETTEVTPMWLPIIVYLSGLAVWTNIASSGPSRSCGSLQVLKLFSQKLARMSWPCCGALALTLDKLAQSQG